MPRADFFMYKHLLLTGLLLLTTLSVARGQRAADADAARYMVTLRDSEIYSPVGDRIIPVGRLNRGLLLNVQPADNGYFIFRFGNASGFIASDSLAAATPPLPAARDVALLHKKARTIC